MEPHDTVRRYADAWAAGDLAGVLDAYHDDVVFHYFGQSPLAGDHVGRDAAVKVLVDATQRSERQLEAIEDVLAGETFGGIVARERLGLGDAARVVRRLLLYRVRDDRLAECWLYDEDQRFVDELWSREPTSTN